VKNAGGAVLVQSDASAAFPDMPRAAIEAGAADLVLELPEIGHVIVELMAGGRFPHPRNEAEAREVLFAGPGPARAALRRVEWSANALGPVLSWPQSLQAIVTTVLHSRFSSCVYWSEDFIQIYNDAWAATVLGRKHPAAAGLPARNTWSERWPSLAGVLRDVVQTGEARELRDQLLERHRDGFVQEAFFTASHSPLHDDRGIVQGVMTLATETTESVLAERRLHALRELTATGTRLERPGAACEHAARVLEENPRDVPFALFYVADTAGMRCTLCAAAGLRQGGAIAPHTVDVFQADAVWPLRQVIRHATPLLLEDLQRRLGAFHAGPWPEAPTAALLLPLGTERDNVVGVLVLGLSPRIALDERYRAYAQLIAQQVSVNRAEARLRERERERLAQLAELDRAKTEFFSNISHEFRTPLTLILAPLEDFLASPDAATNPLRHDMDLAARNAARLLTLVDTLLDFSQIEAGRLKARFEPTDLSVLTADIAALFRSAAERAGLALEVDCSPAPAPVRVDRGMWEKIVSNLLSNALKFTFEGKVTVRLRYLPQNAELEVQDSGVGIAEEEQPRVFRRFHRVRGARARRRARASGCPSSVNSCGCTTGACDCAASSAAVPPSRSGSA
jgi:signal transduction histidine kinase